MSDKYLSDRQTTTSLGYPSVVTITHPYHPLLGQILEVVRVQRKDKSRLLVRHPEGRLYSIPRDWTDFDTLQVEQTEATDAHLLDINGLCTIAKIISNINAESLALDRGEGSDS